MDWKWKTENQLTASEKRNHDSRLFTVMIELFMQNKFMEVF